MNERALLAALRVNHHPDAEPSSVELAALRRSITAYLSTALSGEVKDVAAEWEKAAEGVTPGPWSAAHSVVISLTERHEETFSYEDEEPDHRAVAYCGDEIRHRMGLPFGVERDTNAEWIARCSPSGIRSLLDHLAALSAENARLTTERDEALASKKVTVDIGDALAALQASPELGVAMMEMVAPAAAADVAHLEAEIARLTAQAAEMGEVMDLLIHNNAKGVSGTQAREAWMAARRARSARRAG